MDRRIFYYKQPLASAELNAAFAAAEDADRRIVKDTGLTGIVSGLILSPKSPPTLEASLDAGVAYDKNGVRMAIAGGQTVVMGVDEVGASTAVSGSGNSKYVSVFLTPARTQSDPRTDGNGAAVYFVNGESYKLRVVQGTESPSPTPPPLHATDILLGDALRAYGETTINGFYLTRRETAFRFYGELLEIDATSTREGAYLLAEVLDLHLEGAAWRHSASIIDYSGGAQWADGAPNPSGSVEDALDTIIFSLRSTPGAARVGAAGPYGETAVQGALDAIASRVNASTTALGAKNTTVRGIPLSAAGNPTGFGALDYGGVTSLGASANALTIPFSLPNGSMIRGSTMRFLGSNGHAALPTNKARYALMKYNFLTGTTATIGSTVLDPSGTVAAYQGAHTLTQTGLTETVDNATFLYFLTLYNEDGTNAQSGGRYYPATITYDVPAVDITH